MSRLLYLVTDPITADCFLRGQMTHLVQRGYDVHLASSPGTLLDAVGAATGVAVHPISMAREIRPWSDLRALLALRRLVGRLRPDVVNASTPKAGLLGLLVARWARIAHRIYLVRGLRMETLRGPRRWLVRWGEWTAAGAATRVVCVSDSLRRRYEAHRLAPGRVLEVFGAGSSTGVSLQRFVQARTPGALESARRRLEVPLEAPVIGFVGRLTRDKGIADLVAAFLETVLPRVPEARLVLIGDFEPGDPVDAAARRRIEAAPQIIVHPFIDGLAAEYAAFDVLAFPSYREGFPNAPLEAAACGLPVAGYRATGTVDAVVEGVTGTLVGVGDVAGLGEALVRYLDDPELRRAHGAAGMERADRDFRPEAIWQAWSDFYAELLGKPA